MTDTTSTVAAAAMEKENVMEAVDEATTGAGNNKLSGTKRSAEDEEQQQQQSARPEATDATEKEDPLLTQPSEAVAQEGVDASGDDAKEKEGDEEDETPTKNEAGDATKASAENNNNGDITNNNEEEDDGDEKPAAVEATKIDIQRPVKRARSAYFVFADERRAEVQKQVRPIIFSDLYIASTVHSISLRCVLTPSINLFLYISNCSTREKA